MCKKKTQGEAILTDADFIRKVTGGLFLEFNGGIRVVERIAWIKNVVPGDGIISIQLSLALAKFDTGWVFNETPDSIDINFSLADPISLYLCDGGMESHFVPGKGNHFSVYPVGVLGKPKLAGSFDGLNYYRDRAMKAFRLTSID